MPLDLNQGTFNFHDPSHVESKAAGHFPAGTFQIAEESGTLVKYVCVTSPLDKPSTAKVSNTRIANVYQTLAKGSVPVTAQAVNQTGQSIFVEMNVFASDPAQPSIVVPMQARVELRLPNHGLVTESVAGALLGRVQGFLADEHSNLRVTSMMRGVLSPAYIGG